MCGRGTQGGPSHLLTLEGHRVGKGAEEGVILEASLYGEAVFSSSFQEMYTAALWAGSVRNTNRSGWGCGRGQGRTEGDKAEKPVGVGMGGWRTLGRGHPTGRA